MRRTMGWLAFSVFPGAAVVGVTRAVFFEKIVSAVVHSAEAQGWSVVTTFRRMVENNVENDLDTSPVQRLDHVAELVHPDQINPGVSCTPGAAQRTRLGHSPSS